MTKPYRDPYLETERREETYGDLKRRATQQEQNITALTKQLREAHQLNHELNAITATLPADYLFTLSEIYDAAHLGSGSSENVVRSAPHSKPPTHNRDAMDAWRAEKKDLIPILTTRAKNLRKKLNDGIAWDYSKKLSA